MTYVLRNCEQNQNNSEDESSQMEANFSNECYRFQFVYNDELDWKQAHERKYNNILLLVIKNVVAAICYGPK